MNQETQIDAGPSQCEKEKGLLPGGRVTDQLQIWLQLADGAPASNSGSHHPEALRHINRVPRKGDPEPQNFRRFCFFKH